MSHRLIPESVLQRFEFHEWKHASAILHTDFPNEWADVMALLEQFVLRKSEVIAGGGRKSSIASSLDSFLYNRGWHERMFETAVVVDGVLSESPTHSVDCFKNRVALEVEWNNKDPFFDRDLNNFRLLFDLRAISVGIIVTRGDDLDDVFRPLARAGEISKDKFVDSTTHMGKLLPKVLGGGAGGCPLMVFGITKATYLEDC